jgi:hypothetical protein
MFIRFSMLLRLLQSQQQPRVLLLSGFIPIEGSSIDLGFDTHSPWIVPALRNIRELRVPITTRDGNALKNCAFLLKSIPRLERLCIRGANSTASLIGGSNLNPCDFFGGPHRFFNSAT